MNVSLRKLAFELGVEQDDLRRVANRAGGIYRSFDVRGLGSTKWRHIDHPQDPLASIQRKILRRVLKGVETPPTMTGGLPGRSLLDHARPHTGQPIVITLDLAHCFPSIDNRRVFAIFKNRLRFSSGLASLLTKLTTLRRRLPQGAATSPYLAALATEAMHIEMLELCTKHGLRFTQFVDDLAISGGDGCQDLVPEVIRVAQAHGFALARPKVRVMRADERQIVTGIVVNRGLSAGAQRINEIKEQLSSYRDSLFILSSDAISLEGKLAFVESLRGEQADRLRRFALQCLPARSEFPKMLKSSSIERRDCTCTRPREARSVAPRESMISQASIPGMGRRAFAAAPPRIRTPPRRQKRVAISVGTSGGTATDPVARLPPLSDAALRTRSGIPGNRQGVLVEVIATPHVRIKERLRGDLGVRPEAPAASVRAPIVAAVLRQSACRGTPRRICPM